MHACRSHSHSHRHSRYAHAHRPHTIPAPHFMYCSHRTASFALVATDSSSLILYLSIPHFFPARISRNVLCALYALHAPWRCLVLLQVTQGLKITTGL